MLRAGRLDMFVRGTVVRGTYFAALILRHLFRQAYFGAFISVHHRSGTFTEAL